MTTLPIRAKFFSHYGLETLPVQVEDDGSIWVWDSIAGHYTTCHALSASAQRRIRRLFRAAA